MVFILYIATAMGLYVAAQTDGQWQVVRHTLKDQSLTSIGVSGNILVAGTRDGMWRSADDGRTWHPANENLSSKHVRWITGSTAGKPVFLAGTEPAGIFVSRDGALNWIPGTGVRQLRDRHGWFLPYSPKAGCVRGFSAVDAGTGKSRIYAAVEVGGVLFSEDRGQTWQLAGGSDGNPDFNRELGTMIHPDVHAITVHPTDKAVVTAPTGGGLFRSMDGGQTWRNIYRCYIRAVWVDPGDHSHMIAGPADGVSRNGRIETTTDGGTTWRSSSQGLQTPWRRHMVERFAQAGEALLALLSNGELWARNLSQPNWKRVLPEIPGVSAIAANPGE